MMLLCGISAGYEVGDLVFIAEENALGMVHDGVIGNITAIDDNFICLSDPIYVNAANELIDTNDTEMCIKKSRIAAITMP